MLSVPKGARKIGGKSEWGWAEDWARRLQLLAVLTIKPVNMIAT